MKINIFIEVRIFFSRLPSNIILNYNCIVENKLLKYIQKSYRYNYDYSNETTIKKSLITTYFLINWSTIL